MAATMSGKLICRLAVIEGWPLADPPVPDTVDHDEHAASSAW